jgi:WD40 repeat protein
VSASDDATVRVWSLADSRAEHVLAGHQGRVLALAIAPDGRRAVSGAEDAQLRVWDLAAGQLERILEGHTSAVLDLAVTPDGRYVVSASYDSTVRVWDLATGAERASAHLDGGRLCLALAPAGVTIVVGERSGDVSCLRFVPGAP